MALATNLGFPRIGVKRELKVAIEKYWKGAIRQEELLSIAREIRLKHWELQKTAGLDHIPSNDFSLYDQVLDLIATVGAVPSRYHWRGFEDGRVDLDTYFAMARGCQQGDIDVTAMEMTKWFDTNYHYIVPEFEEHTNFRLSSTKIFDEFAEAKEAGIHTRPVLIGPVTFILLGKGKYSSFDAEKTLKNLLPVYTEILHRLAHLGADWIQIDEPFLSLDLSDEKKQLFEIAYSTLAHSGSLGLKLLLTTYFDSLYDNAQLAFSLPVDGVHIDLCRTIGKANTQVSDSHSALDIAIPLVGDKVLSLGIVDGRNIWKNDLSLSLAIVNKAVTRLGAPQVFVASSCSLLHVPVDLDEETALVTDIRSWMAFAKQKLHEIVTIAKGVNRGINSISDEIHSSDAAVHERKTSGRIHYNAVKDRLLRITPNMADRRSPYSARQRIQHDLFKLPLFPTTTIGSFPQTAHIRKARADFKAKRIDESTYKEIMQNEIKKVVDFQHAIDIDCLVHGEPERNDMVEYFGEQLLGFVFTKNGWVQSYGSRCVKPPIIYGDVSRPKPMTVEWSTYAQSLTQKPMKGMLTGPITMLQWSFVRDDQPRSKTAFQIALAIRDEVHDLEVHGIRTIQIDEPALREGLPLRLRDRSTYLEWAVKAFRLSAAVVEDKTQIHTHMCYSEFDDIIEAITSMDADIISIETSRSQMELLETFSHYKYPSEIGPGVYDIHSPRIPTKEEIHQLLLKAAKVFNVRQIWVNPDCGLKTRGWKEVEPALTNMVAAAKELRASYST